MNRQGFGSFLIDLGIIATVFGTLGGIAAVVVVLMR